MYSHHRSVLALPSWMQSRNELTLYPYLYLYYIIYLYYILLYYILYEQEYAYIENCIMNIVLYMNILLHIV